MKPIQKGQFWFSAETWKLVIAGLVFVTAISTNFWIISKYGNATPFWDSWDGEATSLYVPFFDSALTIDQLLAPLNEHRILTTRLLALFLIELNGLWDPILQMIANAVIHVSAGVCFLLAIRRDLDAVAYSIMSLLVLIVTAVPFAVESTLLGFQSHFYFSILFGLLAVWLMTREKALSWRWLLGFVLAALSYLSLASGALVFLACFLIALSKLVLRIERGQREWLGAVLLLVGFVLALAATPTVGGHAKLRAHSVAEFMAAFEYLAGWPVGNGILSAIVVYIPTIVLAGLLYRSRPAPNSVIWAAIGLGLWIALQLAAVAYARAVGIEAPRYRDIVAIGLLANFVAATLAGPSGPKQMAVIAWAILVLASLAFQAVKAPQDLQAYHAMSLVQERNVRSFLQTGTFPPGAGDPLFTLPYPSSQGLAVMLSDRRVRRFLPSNLQQAISSGEASQTGAATDRLAGIRGALLSLRFTAFGFLFLLVLSLVAFLGRRPVAVPQGKRLCA